MSEPWLLLIDVLGRTLLHFVWQGLILAAALGLALSIVPRRCARVRYALGCAALVLMAAAPVVTAWQLMPGPTGGALPAVTGASASVAHAARIPGHQPDAAMRVGDSMPDLRGSLPPMSWIVGAWLLGVMLTSVRLAGGWWRAQRLLRVGAIAPDPSWLDTVARLAPRVGLTAPVRVLESARIQVPMVIGCVKPVLLLPASALTGFTPRQLEAVLAHELAHIVRHDYLVNLLQSCVETLLFYHPAVWWVSHTVRVEREHCCDDLAVSACGDAILYARALTELEARRQGYFGFAMAASSGSLVSRVRRLVGAPPSTRFASSAWAVAALTALMVAGAGAFGWMQGMSRLVAESSDLRTPRSSGTPVLAAAASDDEDDRKDGEASDADPAAVISAAGRADITAGLDTAAREIVAGHAHATQLQTEHERETREQQERQDALRGEQTALREEQDAFREKQEELRQRHEALEQKQQKLHQKLEKKREKSSRMSARAEELSRELEARAKEIEALTREVMESDEMRAMREKLAREIGEAAAELVEDFNSKELAYLRDPEFSARLSREIDARTGEISRRAQQLAERAVKNIDWKRIEALADEMRDLERSLRALLDERRPQAAPKASPPQPPPAKAPAPPSAPPPAPAPEVRGVPKVSPVPAPAPVPAPPAVPVPPPVKAPSPAAPSQPVSPVPSPQPVPAPSSPQPAPAPVPDERVEPRGDLTLHGPLG